MYERLTKSPAETRRLGEWLGQRLQPGDFVALVGDLGAGKTHLSSGILAGLGVARTGGSPTFTLLWEYQGRSIPVYHWDVYRVKDPLELEDLGYEEYFWGEGVNLVEWADRIEELWPEEHLVIRLAHAEGESERRLTATGTARFRPLLEALGNADFGA
ncbi:MAG TPA: tRNA (adenosine(37)-N6)-threonylcarbamoyltransferase complex ATPase subunit type 1 TsaE [Symbiobacteriaceae bacterium]|nr:tRNA (adenosine(37)-N6)-threonylcarbamoyltransferase complex ATPase subunit type 1 TsaE [Symbiobacteriaceae bacterium]